MNVENRFQVKKCVCGILCFLTVLTSCSNKKNTDSAEELSRVPENAEWISESAVHELPHWIAGDYPRIAVLFGHGYTREGEETAERERIESVLADQFGLADDNGLIIPLIFDSSYIEGKKIRLAFISELLAGYTLDGLVVVAAPERTYAALDRLQDSGAAYPIYSVFPQDESLETEGASTFVLDYNHAVTASGSDEEIESLTPEEEGGYAGDVAKVLVSVIQTMKNRSKLATEGETLSAQIQSIVASLQKEMEKQGEQCTIEPFIDPESGIRSQNHYVVVQ